MKIYINARFLTQPVSGVQRYGIECSRQIKVLYPAAVFLTPPNIHSQAEAAHLGAVVVGTHTGHRWEQTDLPHYLKKLGNPPLFNPANTAPLRYANNYVTIHDLAFRYHPEWNSRAFSMWYNFLIPRIAARARAVFTVSETVKGELIKEYGLPEEKIMVTYNGVPANMLAATNMPTQRQKKVLTVGSFNKRKNHHLLLQGFLKSSLPGQGFVLELVGDKNKVFADAGIHPALLNSPVIKIRSHLSEAELFDAYRSAAIVASLSHYEGFGIPILEGLYSGCAVLCSDIPVYRELYANFAHFCSPNDVDAIVQTLELAARQQGSMGHLPDLLAKCNYHVAACRILNGMAGTDFPIT